MGTLSKVTSGDTLKKGKPGSPLPLPARLVRPCRAIGMPSQGPFRRHEARGSQDRGRREPGRGTV